jgi:hypothetical protein
VADLPQRSRQTCHEVGKSDPWVAFAAARHNMHGSVWRDRQNDRSNLPMNSRDGRTINPVFHHETERAVLVSENGDRDSAVWIPKSQIKIDPDNLSDGDTCKITLPAWLSEKKGLS